jgi:hypothetical protein
MGARWGHKQFVEKAFGTELTAVLGELGSPTIKFT